MNRALLVGVLLFVIGGALSCAVDEPTPRDGVFVHITRGADDPHRLLMALQMASLMADSHDVLVYFDINAADAVLADAEDVQFAHFASLHTQLRALAEKGVPLMACPGCLQVIGKTGDDLAEGVEVADKAAFFSFTKGRILTIDY